MYHQRWHANVAVLYLQQVFTGSQYSAFLKGVHAVKVTAHKCSDLLLAAEFYRQPVQFMQQWCQVISLRRSLYLDLELVSSGFGNTLTSWVLWNL